MWQVVHGMSFFIFPLYICSSSLFKWNTVNFGSASHCNYCSKLRHFWPAQRVIVTDVLRMTEEERQE